MFPAADEYDIAIDIEESAVNSLLDVAPSDVSPPAELTFSRNVFVPLTTACRYTCSYCTYYDVPGEATLMSPAAIRDVVETGVDAGCTEALFTFGDKPDDRYTEIHAQLDEWGYDSIIDYLYAACEIALAEGLLPHSNPGDITQAEFRRLREVNSSMGVMLETTAAVDAHSGGRRKTPGQRLNTIRAAGREGVPFTTGLLVGIGETWRDRAESLLAIREAWPALAELNSIADDAGLPLYERLPVYDRYLPASIQRGESASAPDAVDADTWLSTRIRDAITANTAGGRRYRAVARCERQPVSQPQG